MVLLRNLNCTRGSSNLEVSWILRLFSGDAAAEHQTSAGVGVVGLSVVVVNYNGRAFIGDLLDSLSEQSLTIDETIVIDNASTDGSTEFIKLQFPRVTLIPLGKNVGFAKGNNIGCENSRGEYVAVLNSDTLLAGNCLFELVRVLDSDPQIGAVVPKIYRMDSSQDTPLLECAGAEFNNLGFCWGRGANQLDGPPFATATEVSALTACAMVIRRSALNW